MTTLQALAPPLLVDPGSRIRVLLRALATQALAGDEQRPRAVATEGADIRTLRPSSPEVLFKSSYTRLVQSLSLIAGSVPVAEDAVQEAMITACAKWDRIKKYDDPVGWVRRVAINKLHNQRRSGTRRNTAVERLGAVAPMSAPAADSAATSVAVIEALRSLPDRQRTAAVLFYVDDLLTADIAKAMGISLGSVSTHLDRARHALRNALGDGR